MYLGINKEVMCYSQIIFNKNLQNFLLYINDKHTDITRNSQTQL